MASRFLVPFSSGRGLSSVHPFLDLHREMNRLFDDAFRGIGLPANFTGGSQGISMPRLDMHEQDNELCVEADLPGVTASDVDLQIDDDVLTISAETKSDSQREQQNYHVMERSRGRYLRRVQLPYRPDPQQVKADFENGVLSVHIPKQPEQQRSRRIQVRSEGGDGRQSIEAQPGGGVSGGAGASNGGGASDGGDRTSDGGGACQSGSNRQAGSSTTGGRTSGAGSSGSSGAPGTSGASAAGSSSASSGSASGQSGSTGSFRP